MSNIVMEQSGLNSENPQIRVAFETVLWGQRIDDLDYMLRVLKACGYEGIEIAQDPSNIFVRDEGETWPVGDVNALVGRCASHGIQVLGLVGGRLEERVRYLGKRRDIYLYLDSWPEDALQYLVQDDPITLCIHPHWFMEIRRRSHVEALFKKVHEQLCEYFLREQKKVQSSNLEAGQIALQKAEKAFSHLRLIIDTAHAVIAEDDPVSWVTDSLPNERPMDVTKHPLQGKLENPHLKGWRPDHGRWSHRYPKGFCVPNQGIVPVAAVMNALVAGGYSGWIVLEQDHFEDSREETACACAQWIAENGNNWPLVMKPDVSAVKSLVAKRLPNPFLETFERPEMNGLPQALFSTPPTSPEAFYRSVVTALNTLLKPEFAKLFSFNPSTKHFYLLDALHRDDRHVTYQTALSHAHTLAGQVATTSAVLIHDLSDERVRRQFSNQNFLQQVTSRWLVCVPIFNAANAHHLRGMFAIFTDTDLCKNKQMLELLAYVIAMWADYVGGEACAAAVGATNYLCGTVTTGVESFVNELHDHVQRVFNCENVSIFLRDASRTRLEAAGKCKIGIKWNEKLPPAQHHYKMGEGLTGRCWQEREMLFVDHAPEAPGHVGKSKDMPLLTAREEVLFAPLARLNGEALGVIRLRNKRPRSGSPATTMFTDDDAAKLDAIIQSALPYLELLFTQKDQAQSLVRLNHELQNPLIGITGAAELLQFHLKRRGIPDLKDAFGADYLDDILSYKDLMSRLVLNAKLFGDSFGGLQPEFERCDLATTVVEPVARQLRPLFKRYSLPEDRIHIDRFQGTIPWLWVDKLMMQQVFFNLLVNAIKCRDRKDEFRVFVQVASVPDTDNPREYWIDVVDYGVGLDADPEAPERMFLSGVRGVSASFKQDVSGSGIGLSVVREVMRKHGGKVYFVPNEQAPDSVLGLSTYSASFLNRYRKPTRIRLVLPAELRHGKPQSK